MAGQKYGKMSTIPENAEISSYTSEPPNIELELNKKRMEEGKGSGLESGMEIENVRGGHKISKYKRLGITNKSDRGKSAPLEDLC
jgi:hypothetical protein